MQWIQDSHPQDTGKRHERDCKTGHGGNAKIDMTNTKSPDESVRLGRNNIVGRKLGGET